MVTVGCLGGTGQHALEDCDLTIVLLETDTARIQECHITLGYIIRTILEDRIVQAGMG